MTSIPLTNKEWAGLLGIISHNIDNNQVEYMFHSAITLNNPNARLNIRRLINRYLERENLPDTIPEPGIKFWEGVYIVSIVLSGKLTNKYTGIIHELNIFTDNHYWEELKRPTYIKTIIDILIGTYPYGIISTSTFQNLKNIKGEYATNISTMVTLLLEQEKGHAHSRT